MKVKILSNEIVLEHEGQPLNRDSVKELSLNTVVVDVPEGAILIFEHDGDDYIMDSSDFSQIKAALETALDSGDIEAGQITVEQVLESLSIESTIDPITGLIANILFGKVHANYDTITVTLQKIAKVEEDFTVDNGNDGVLIIGPDGFEPSISIVKTVEPGSVDEPGGEVTYTYMLTNTSIAAIIDPLTITSLVDDNATPFDFSDDIIFDPIADLVSGDINGNLQLDAGETWIYTYTTTIQNVTAIDGSIINTVKVIAQDDEGNMAMDDDTAEVIVEDVDPEIELIKEVEPDALPEPGGMVTYTYTLTNVGVAAIVDPLTITSLVDDNATPLNFSDDIIFDPIADLISGDDNNNGLLDFGEEWVYEYTTTIMGASAADGSIINTAKVVAEDDEGTMTMDDDTAEVIIEDVDPEIELIKEVEPDALPEPGGMVTYTYTLTNVGVAAIVDPLTITSLVDDNATPLNFSDDIIFDPIADLISGDDNNNGLLDFGEEWLYEYTTTIMDASAADGSIINTAKVVAEDDEGNMTMDDDIAEVIIEDVDPEIKLEKTADKRCVKEGESVTYTYELTNVGSSAAGDPLTIDSLVDDNATPFDLSDDIHFDPIADLISGDDNNNGLLDFGEVWKYEYTVDMMDANHNPRRPVVNKAKVKAFDDEGNMTMDMDKAKVFVKDVKPEIQLEKTADKRCVKEGESVTYTYELTNLGLAVDPLMIVSLVDDNATPLNLSDDIHFDPLGDLISGDTNMNGLLDTGEVWKYEHTVNMIDANHHPWIPVINKAKVIAKDDEWNMTMDHDYAKVFVKDVKPEIHLDKTANKHYVKEGESVTYTYELTNLGLAVDPLMIVSLVDDNATPLDLSDDIHFDPLGDLISGDTNMNGLLDTGEVWKYEHTVNMMDAPHGHHGGFVVNKAKVIAKDDEWNMTMDHDYAKVFVKDVKPEIQLEKTADKRYVKEGESVTYEYKLTNLGLMVDPLTITFLKDDNATPFNPFDDIVFHPINDLVSGDLNSNNKLDAGEVWIYEHTVDSIYAPCHGGLVVNKAKVIAFDDEWNATIDTDKEEVYVKNIEPQIHLEFCEHGEDFAGLSILSLEEADNMISGDDFIGTVDNDVINGSSGNDSLHGLPGNDTLFGGESVDYLFGGDGHDLLYGGGATDYLTGGDGNDTFVFDGDLQQPDYITDFSVVDNNNGNDNDDNKDVLDVSQLLSDILGGAAPATDDIDTYVNLMDGTGANSGDVVVQVFDGSFKNAFILESTTLVDLNITGGFDTAQEMYDAGQLKVEVS